MLTCFKGPSRKIEKVYREDHRLVLEAEYGNIILEPKTDKIIRVLVRPTDREIEHPGIIMRETFEGFSYEEREDKILLSTDKVKVSVYKEDGKIDFYDIKEERKFSAGGKTLDFEEFTTYKLSDQSIETYKVQTADGEKTILKDAAREETGKSYHIRLPLYFEEEALYGLGQHEEGYASLRGKRIYLHQANRKIAVPFFVSTKGYGVLVDTYSPAIFDDHEEESYFYVEACKQLDFYYIAGENPNDVIDGFRQLTGKASMLPKWAFGHMQSQERYETAEEMIAVAGKSREKGLGIDSIVLDWCSWEDNMWGQKSFDPKRFSNPQKMIEDLHDLHTHFMISVWPNMDAKTENYKEFKDCQLLLPASDVYNPFAKEGRELYWKQLQEGLFQYGVDAWWCDSSEAFTPEWTHMVRPEASRAYEEFCKEAGGRMSEEYCNSFCLYHAQSIYEGQRSVTDNKRVVNLTRSGYTGAQRYGTILWSGDIEATWDTFRKQIATGFNFCASGLPYWTVDVGAFFVKNGAPWYWHGDYDLGIQDMGYRELFVRMYQWACFLPIFRVHGTDVRRELWEYGEEGSIFYEALKKTNQMRYRLLPYIYSEAGKVWLYNRSLIRPLAFDYSEDSNTWNLKDQYLFGEALMVCPVTEPMYYEKNNVKIDVAKKTRKIYLPNGNAWYEMETKEKYEGGRWIEVSADINTIPVFVKEGSIIPITDPALSTEESQNVDFIVFSNKECSYQFYSDQGDGYGYERGEYTVENIIRKGNQL